MTTFLQIVLVFAVVLGAAYPNPLLGSIKQILIYLVATLATVSAFQYSVSIARNLSSPPPTAKPGPVSDRDNARS
jgi:phosphatidylglycerophosphate synthase